MSVGVNISLAAVAAEPCRTGDEYRLILGVWTELADLDDSEAAVAIIDAPCPTGDERLDAAFAAVAEHLAYQRDIGTPPWCAEPFRFLRRSWFPVTLPSVWVTAFVTSPASFARRGIYIDRRDLDRV